MVGLRCDETTVYATVAVTCTVLLLFAVLRAAVGLLGAFIARATKKFMRPAVERVLCAVGAVVSIVVFADGSALLPALLLLASATGAAFCRSLLSFRWLWVSSFTLYSLVLLNLVGPLLVEDVDVTKQEWVALVRKQRVLVPSFSAIAAASPAGGRASSRYLYSYYDAVKIEGSASPLMASARATPRMSVESISGFLQQQHAWETKGSEKDSTKVTKSSLTQQPQLTEDLQPTYHIIASGDDTLLTHLAELKTDDETFSISFAYSISLLGQHSQMQHSRVHCLVSAHDPSLSFHAHSSCLRLHRTALLRNVTIYWAEVAGGAAVSTNAKQLEWHVLHAGQEGPQSCVEVQNELAARVSAKHDMEDRESTTVSAAVTSFLSCVEELSVSELPPFFVAKAPFPVRFGWHFPGYLHRAQETFFYVSDRVIIPFAIFAADVMNVCGGVIASLLRLLGNGFVRAMPYVKHAANEVALCIGGLVCGGGGSRRGGGRTAITHASSAFSSLSMDAAMEAQATVLYAYAPAATGCAAFRRAHAAHTAFRAGVQTRMSVLAVLSVLADATDLFPGVWTVCKWAWNAEVTFTMWILEGLGAMGYFLVFIAPRPLLCVLGGAARILGVVLLRLCAPLRELWRGFIQMPLLPYVSRLLCSLWSLEARWLCYEWSLFKRVAIIFVCKGEAGLVVLMRLVAMVFRNSGWLATRYGQTSFSIHLVVTFLQSMLLIIALWNEMRALIDAERQRPSGAHSPLRFLKRWFPQSVALFSPLQTITARVNGFGLLIRAHHQACMHYLLLHSIGMLVLIGLSVLPFMNKLYSLSLRYFLPWMSAKAFLIFFYDSPSAPAAAALFVLRMAVSTLLQQTIGDFLYYIVRDIMIAAGLAGGLALALWTWPQRTELAKQVATAISDSLQGTPMPKVAQVSLSSAAREGHGKGALEGEKRASSEDDTRGEDAVTRQIDLSNTA
ncbi:hypothetical protein ABB37_00344 [Leptomonas pyrrhocoris]|uniref:Transmembrane protein n=1 Tax=Leptomonas pyrrhocoris TaxID=157538 RepID=A0A0M9GAB3_LEPPY|nr:hypothetical protein ABB37_00344 [Leptomonas pyrrhocoris]KPA86077.1 hypothetical protein ABB37_00344 [Leptomonas pyrrhocoris]|eukprot:XP_015664516.1 hypothetical protein ABB37_00344 [Leptomonas pyrrhocoris]